MRIVAAGDNEPYGPFHGPPFDHTRGHGSPRAAACSTGRRASHDNRFEVGLHHPLHAKLLRNSMEFIELETLAAPRFCQRFERNIEADFVAESKTVRNRS